MKSDELVRRINNGEIKDGTEFTIQKNGSKCATNIIFDGKERVLRFNFRKSLLVNSSMLLHNDFEFEIVEEHKGWFKPVEDDYYYYIDHAGMIRRDVWKDSGLNYYHYNHHNCFRTKEEAQEYLDYKNALKEAECFVVGKDNYYIYASMRKKELLLATSAHCKNQGVTYLGQDKDAAQAFIDKWKKQILKYEFDVWE